MVPTPKSWGEIHLFYWMTFIYYIYMCVCVLINECLVYVLVCTMFIVKYQNLLMKFFAWNSPDLHCWHKSSFEVTWDQMIKLSSSKHWKQIFYQNFPQTIYFWIEKTYYNRMKDISSLFRQSWECIHHLFFFFLTLEKNISNLVWNSIFFIKFFVPLIRKKIRENTDIKFLYTHRDINVWKVVLFIFILAHKGKKH